MYVCGAKLFACWFSDRLFFFAVCSHIVVEEFSNGGRTAQDSTIDVRSLNFTYRQDSSSKHMHNVKSFSFYCWLSRYQKTEVLAHIQTKNKWKKEKKGKVTTQDTPEKLRETGIESYKKHLCNHQKNQISLR